GDGRCGCPRPGERRPARPSSGRRCRSGPPPPAPPSRRRPRVGPPPGPGRTRSSRCGGARREGPGGSAAGPLPPGRPAPARAGRGPLIPFDKVLVVADERLLRDVIAASLPFERVIRDRYLVRVLRAEVHLEDGLGLVRLEGDARFADQPASEGQAEVTVYGSL